MGTMKTVSEFNDWIRELSIWSQFEVKACLIRFNNSKEWHIGFLQILLLETYRASNDTEILDYEHVRFIHQTYDIKLLDSILEDLERGKNIRLENMILSLDLMQSQTYTELHMRQYIRNNFGIDEPCYLLTRTGEFSKLRDILKQIEFELRKVDPPFESLRDLSKSKFNVDFGTNAFPLFIRIFCPLYAKISKFYLENKKLHVELQFAAKMEPNNLFVNVLGKNRDGVAILRRTISKFTKESRNTTNIEPVKLPEDIFSLETKLFFDKEVVDESYYISENPKDVLKKGLEYINLQQFDKAFLSFWRAIESDPNNHDLIANVADMFIQLGKYDDGLELYDRIIKDNPKNAVVIYKKGLALSDLGKFWEAIRNYDASLEINPKYADVWNYRDLALVDLQRYEDAIESFDKYLELKPNDPYVLNTKGLCVDHLGDHKKALQLYDEALKINPNVAEAWNNKGFVFNELRRYEDAIRSYDRALQINSRDANAWHNKGIVLLTIGQLEAALECFDTAVKLNEYLAPSWYAKGQTLEKLQRYAESIESFKRAETIDPKYSVVRSLEETPIGQVQNQVNEIKSEILSKTIDPNLVNETKRKTGIIDRTAPTKLALSNLGIKNFRSIRETLLRLKPITLLFGPNSSGKSSILHTILLMKQTLEGSDNENPLLLNGKYLNFGTANDISFFHDLEKKVELSMNIENVVVPIEGNLVPFSSTLSAVFEFNKRNKKIMLQEINLTIDEVSRLVIKNQKIYYHHQNKIYNIILREVERKKFLYMPQGPNLPSLKHYIDAVESLERMKSRLDSKSKELRNELNQDIRLIKTYLGITDKVSVSAISNGIRILKAYSDRINQLLTENTYYVGPIRRKPFRHYESTGESHNSVGSEGEFVFSLLRGNADKKNKVMLNKWLRQMDLTHRLVMDRVSDQIFSVIFTDPITKLPINSMDVGFGTSQLLPIIVQSIWAPRIRLYYSNNLRFISIQNCKEGWRICL